MTEGIYDITARINNISEIEAAMAAEIEAALNQDNN